MGGAVGSAAPPPAPLSEPRSVEVEVARLEAESARLEAENAHHRRKFGVGLESDLRRLGELWRATRPVMLSAAVRFRRDLEETRLDFLRRGTPDKIARARGRYFAALYARERNPRLRRLPFRAVMGLLGALACDLGLISDLDQVPLEPAISRVVAYLPSLPSPISFESPLAEPASLAELNEFEVAGPPPPEVGA